MKTRTTIYIDSEVLDRARELAWLSRMPFGKYIEKMLIDSEAMNIAAARKDDGWVDKIKSNRKKLADEQEKESFGKPVIEGLKEKIKLIQKKEPKSVFKSYSKDAQLGKKKNDNSKA